MHNSICIVNSFTLFLINTSTEIILLFIFYYIKQLSQLISMQKFSISSRFFILFDSIDHWLKQQHETFIADKFFFSYNPVNIIPHILGSFLKYFHCSHFFEMLAFKKPNAEKTHSKQKNLRLFFFTSSVPKLK